ncbi:undecaprenyldiphospho-muramoylpentapeptide beta-N-acetylglucosaminyltransferase [Ornithobacterium rhinotracheale]|uniref:undecaprenyldiphospho-muramoylpentapeptide beta-N-acetylglucosaminyltransferase n=1 Tax=Ornithobacterium rhinotracheale TaxID=28251 RepID=UPI0040371517
MKRYKFILSGGGTGGHIYPAIAIADEIKRRLPEAEILFVGAKGKMEMEKVPKAGYPIEGLWISGFQRSNLLANLSFPFKLMSSWFNARKIIKNFKPDATIGTGGFASGPIMWVAEQNKIPVLVQEQNSYPGITNKILKDKAFAFCTAYTGMENYFPKERVHFTGNPIRGNLFENLPEKTEAKKAFGLNPEKPVILSVGGSLGAQTLNNAWKESLNTLSENGIQLIWQTGKPSFDELKKLAPNNENGIHITDFIYNMQQAYAAADIIVSRAGAMAISELCLIGKPTILVPYPFAAEDHQTKNAQNLVDHQAAIMIEDKAATESLVKTTIDLAKDTEKQQSLGENIAKLAKPKATQEIVDILFNHLKID